MAVTGLVGSSEVQDLYGKLGDPSSNSTHAIKSCGVLSFMLLLSAISTRGLSSIDNRVTL